MSAILEKYFKEFIHPTPFELHYSDSHREKYLSDSNYVCGGITDRDLAAHLTVIIHRGICLYGKEIKEVSWFGPYGIVLENSVHTYSGVDRILL